MTITAKTLIRGIALSGLASLLLGCATQQRETTIPATRATLAAEDVQSIPIRKSVATTGSASTHSQCRQEGSRLRCTNVNRDELRDRFNELQSLDRY